MQTKPHSLSRRMLIFCAVALLCFGVGGLVRYRGAFARAYAGGDRVAVLVAAQDIPYGLPVRAEMLTTRDMPEAYVDARYLRASQLREVVGVPLSEAILAGQMLVQNDLNIYTLSQRMLSENVPQGLRAVAAAANNLRSFGGLIRPGDRLDVAVQSVGDRPMHTMLLSNIPVLALGERFEGGGENNSARRVQTVVTLLATPEQASLLAEAESEGTLLFYLRNPGDGQALGPIRPATEDLLTDPSARRAYVASASRVGW